MSSNALALGPVRGVPGGRLRRLVQDPEPRRVMAVLAVIVIAYHYSLSTLLRTLQLETPLAYLGLVPLIALGLAVTRHRAAVDEPAIHDRQVDYIIGLPLLGAAAAINLLLPIRLSTMFWVWRIDLLSLPLFVAGTVAIVLGTRMLWRLRLPIAFLLFAWPLPYSLVLVKWLGAFSDVTIAALKMSLHAIPVASATPGSDGSLFAVSHGTGRFVVSVASACSGVNGVVGYLLVGVAFVSVVAGKTSRKVAWLATGLVVIWVLNILRILMIFAAGSIWGERAAIDGLHPFLGLITFNVGILIMILSISRFGLRLRAPGTRTRTEDSSVSPQTRSAVPKARIAVTVVVAVGLLAAVSNSGLRDYDLVAGTLGTPRLAAFSTTPAEVAGWSSRRSDSYTWARRFFGQESTWYRYQYRWDGSQKSDFRSNAPVIGDVISTADVSTFSTYGLEACYKFHGYKLKARRTVDLGGGIIGTVLSYWNSAIRSDWTTVYWHWPVKTAKGTRYERVTLMLIDSAKAHTTSPAPSPSVARALALGFQNATSGQPGPTDTRMTQTRAFLVSFAGAVVKGQKAAPTASNQVAQ